MGSTGDPDRWARLRFAIIGPLLAAPPPRGELQQQLLDLSSSRWQHPVNGTDIQFSVTTIERWFYAARQAADPVGALRRKRRSDAGRARRLTALQIQAVEDQYQQHKGWTVQLHVDNLVALAEEDKALKPITVLWHHPALYESTGTSSQAPAQTRHPGGKARRTTPAEVGSPQL